MPLAITVEGLAKLIPLCETFAAEIRTTANRIPWPILALDDMIAAVERKYNTNVEILLVPVDSRHVHGLCEIWNGNVIIYVDERKPRTMRRYIIVKELTHRVIWDNISSTQKPDVLIEHIMQQTFLFNGTNGLPKDVEAEGMAMFGAIEFLFPMQYRYQCKEKIYQKEGGVNTFTISQKLGMPQHVVEFALSDSYMQTCQKIRGDEDLR